MRNLANKYKIDPSIFGLKNTPAPQSSGMGSAAPAFGQTSGFGSTMATSSPFGQSTGFGGVTAQKSSTFGQSFGSPSGFGQQTASGFGALSGNSGFGNSSFSPQATTSPFGAPRR